ncbi:unnamed protein product [Caenorhabditis sp. 36 PRJEB53466]|nr:unnamed protein product [Caenorhabditis sp. 36 PRJEB53466]
MNQLEAIQFFGKLEILALDVICEHLEPAMLLTTALYSERFEEAAKRKLRLKMLKDAELEMTVGKHCHQVAKVSLRLPGEPPKLNRNVVIFEKRPRLAGPFFYNSIESSNAIHLRYDSIEEISAQVLRVRNMILECVPSVNFRRMSLTFDDEITVAEFRGTVEGTSVGELTVRNRSGELNGREVQRLLKKTKVTDRLIWGLMTRGDINLSKIKPKPVDFELSIHQNTTRDCWFNIKSEYLRISDYENVLTEKDLNAFLQNWRSGKGDHPKLVEYFNKKGLDLTAILEGLDAKPWKPERRDRKIKNMYGPLKHMEHVPFTDLGKGVDIVRRDGTIGTVLCDHFGVGFKFYTWPEPFPMRPFLADYEEIVRFTDELLSNFPRIFVVYATFISKHFDSFESFEKSEPEIVNNLEPAHRIAIEHLMEKEKKRIVVAEFNS